MANIKIAELEQVQTEFEELSDMELETIIGGKSYAPNVILQKLGGIGIAFRF